MGLLSTETKIIVDCTLCGLTIDLVDIDFDELGPQLKQHGWSWLRGDENYDHVCNCCRQNDYGDDKVKDYDLSFYS
jgi:hypothetical protein